MLGSLKKFFSPKTRRKNGGDANGDEETVEEESEPVAELRGDASNASQFLTSAASPASRKKVKKIRSDETETPAPAPVAQLNVEPPSPATDDDA